MTTDILIGGVSAAAILAFLVQTTRESTGLQSKHIPLVCLVYSVLLLVGALYLPESLTKAVAASILLAAAVSASVRYVKNGDVKEDDPTEHPAATLQGNVVGVSGNSRPQGFGTTTTTYTERPDRVSNFQSTQPLPHLEEI